MRPYHSHPIKTITVYFPLKGYECRAFDLGVFIFRFYSFLSYYDFLSLPTPTSPLNSALWFDIYGLLSVCLISKCKIIVFFLFQAVIYWKGLMQINKSLSLSLSAVRVGSHWKRKQKNQAERRKAQKKLKRKLVHTKSGKRKKTPFKCKIFRA